MFEGPRDAPPGAQEGGGSAAEESGPRVRNSCLLFRSVWMGWLSTEPGFQLTKTVCWFLFRVYGSLYN